MLKWLVRLFIVLMLGAVLGVASLIGIYFYIKPQLPDVSALRDVKLATPMKVYSRDGELISSSARFVVSRCGWMKSPAHDRCGARHRGCPFL